MHLKLIVFFAAVAACSASGLIDYGYGLSGGHHAGYVYHIAIQGDHVIVTGQDGTYFDIFYEYAGGHERYIHVHVNGHDFDLKTYQFVDHQVAGGVSQWDVLYQIFTQFVGHVDEQTYVQLLHVLFKHVVNHDVHPVVVQGLYFLYQHVHHFQGVDLQGQFGQFFDQDFLGLWSQFGHWGQYGGQWGHGYYGKNYYGAGYQAHHYGWPSYHQGYAHQGGFYGPYASDVYSHKGYGYGHGYVPQNWWWNLHGGQYKHFGGDYQWNQNVGAGFYGHHYAQPHLWN